MSIKLMALVFDLPFKPKHKLVLLCLSNYANDEGRNVYPSLTTIQVKTSLSRSAVACTLNDLKADGFLLVESRGDVRRQSNRYQISVKSLEELLSSTPRELVRPDYKSLVRRTVRTSPPRGPDPSPIHQIDPSSIVRAKKKSTKPDDSCPKDWMERLYKLCGIDPVTASSGLRKRISEAGKAILKAGGKLEQVEQFETWWLADSWRQKHIPIPTPEQLRDKWPQAMKGLHNGNNRTITKVPEYSAAQLEAAERINAARAAKGERG